MTLDEGVPDALDVSDAARTMALHWQLRCAARRTAVAEATGRQATSLCEAVVETLGNPSRAAHLTEAARGWTDSVANADEARAALLCLCEVATELDGELTSSSWSPDGLDAVLGALVAEAARVSTKADTARHDATDMLTGCPGRRALEQDIGVAVAAAAAAGGDVAVATVQLDSGRKHLGVVRSAGARPDAGDAAVLGLVATLRRSMGRAEGLYRVGPTSFAVLAADTATAGALALRAECLPGPRFSWGVAGFAAVGAAAVESPDLLLVVAEADRELRRRELARIDAATTRRRRMSAVAAAAAATILVAGVTVGFGTSSGAPVAHVHAALPAGGNAGHPGQSGASPSASSGDRFGAHRLGSSASPGSVSSGSASPGSASPGAASSGTGEPAAGSAPGTQVPASTPTVPATANAPAAATLALFTRTPSSAPPAAPSAATTTPPPPPVPAAIPPPPTGPGNSAKAPGHLKGHHAAPTHP